MMKCTDGQANLHLLCLRMAKTGFLMMWLTEELNMFIYIQCVTYSHLYTMCTSNNSIMIR